LEAIGLDTSLNEAVYAAILVVWLTALYFAIAAVRREREPVLETETS